MKFTLKTVIYAACAIVFPYYIGLYLIQFLPVDDVSNEFLLILMRWSVGFFVTVVVSTVVSMVYVFVKRLIRK